MAASVAVVSAMTLFLFGALSGVGRLVIWLGMVICMAFVVWTASRMSLLLVLVFFLVLTVLHLVGRKTILLPATLGTGVILAFLLSLPFSVFSWTGIDRTIHVSQVEIPATTVEHASLEQAADKLSSGRVAIWQEAIRVWQASPWFGHGPNSTLFVLKLPAPLDQPHNLFLQFLLEWGAVGGLALTVFLVLMGWEGLKRLPAALRDGDADYLVSASVAGLLVANGLTDGSFYHVQTVLCFATAAAVFPFGRPQKPG